MINALPTKKFYTITFLLMILETTLSVMCAHCIVQPVALWFFISLLQPTSVMRLMILGAWVLAHDFCIAGTIITPLIMLIIFMFSAQYVRTFLNHESVIVCTGIILFFDWVHAHILAFPSHNSFFFIPYTWFDFFAILLLIELLLKYGFMDRWTIAHRKISSR